MSDSDKALDGIQASKTNTEAGKSKLLSPEPERRKMVTELLLAFANRKLSFADLTGLDVRKVKQVAEMGYNKLRHGRYEEARKIFEVLTFIDHKNYFHRLALGGAYQKIKKYIDAAFQYGEVLKGDPKNTNALVNRGEIFLRQKNYRKAAEDFREAILSDETGKDKFANRARSLVIAIKRSLARDKDLKSRGIDPKAQQKTLSTRKKISPLAVIKNPKKK